MPSNHRLRTGIVTLALLGLALVPVPAEEADRPVAVAVAVGTRRVPPHYGQVGLTAAQRAEVYAIQAKHKTEIDTLRRRIEEETAKMKAECDAVLTAPQHAIIEDLRLSSTKRRKPVAAGVAH